MENLNHLVEEGQKLAEKRTWLVQGYERLLSAINTELAKIPDMKEVSIVYRLREWQIESINGYTNYHAVSVVLYFEDDASIALRHGHGYEPNGGDWEWEDTNSPSIATIREFAAKLPDMVDYFLGEVTKRNMENQIAIDTITGLLSKITS